jgi:hypothetical protein
MILAGASLLVYGGRFPTTALFVMTTALIGTILLFLVYKWLPQYTPEWLVYIILYFAFSNGLVLGFGATLSPKVGVTACGAAFGFFFGVIVDLTIVTRFVTYNSITSQITVICFVFIFTLLSVLLYDYAVILYASIFGSYMLWRGFSLMIGGFPSETMIMVACYTSQISGLPWTFWCWISCMVVSTISAAIVQLAHRRKNIELYKYKQQFEVVRYFDFRTMRKKAQL